MSCYRLTPAGAEEALLGDKGYYDPDVFVQAIQGGMQAVIPPRRNRIAPLTVTVLYINNAT